MENKGLIKIKLILDSFEEFDGICEIDAHSLQITYTNSSKTYESVLVFLAINEFRLHTESIHKIGDNAHNTKIYSITAPNIPITDDYAYNVYLLFNLHKIGRMELANETTRINSLPPLYKLWDSYLKYDQ